MSAVRKVLQRNYLPRGADYANGLPMNFQEQPEGPSGRVAHSVAQVSAMFGKHRSWGHRQVKKGRINAIVGFGITMISDQEVKRILGKQGNS